MNILIVLIVFILIALSSVVWAIYIKNIAEGNPMKAGIADAVLHFTAGLVVLAYVDDWRYLIVVIIASFIGTYYKVKHDVKVTKVARWKL